MADTCIGCLDDIANQLAHMDIGGCLATKTVTDRVCDVCYYKKRQANEATTDCSVCCKKLCDVCYKRRHKLRCGCGALGCCLLPGTDKPCCQSCR